MRANPGFGHVCAATGRSSAQTRAVEIYPAPAADTSFPLGDQGYLFAEQALDLQESDPRMRHDYCLWEDDQVSPQRPSPDWDEMVPLAIARAQLDEFTRLLSAVTGVSEPLRHPERAIQSLRLRYAESVSMASDDGEFELSGVEEGLALRMSLEGDVLVGHGYAVDGSITITIGPFLAECAVLGVRGGMELLDPVGSVFTAARRAMECLAWLAHRIPRRFDGPRRGGVEPRVEVMQNCVDPFYLSLMGFNAPRSRALIPQVRAASQHLDETDVIELLEAPWRPRVMGAWLSLLFDTERLTAAVRESLLGCLGYLTSPAMAVAVVRKGGPGAMGTLVSYAESSEPQERPFIAAAAEHLADRCHVPNPMLEPPAESRAEFALMYDFGVRLAG